MGLGMIFGLAAKGIICDRTRPYIRELEAAKNSRLVSGPAAGVEQTDPLFRPSLHLMPLAPTVVGNETVQGLSASPPDSFRSPVLCVLLYSRRATGSAGKPRHLGPGFFHEN